MAKNKENAAVQVELELDEAKETEVQISSDKEEDVSQGASSEGVVEDEHEKHISGAEKRINALTKKMREAERQKEEALRYAQTVQQESNQVKERLKSLDQGYMTEHGGRLEVEQRQVEADLKRAVELGDAEATVEAQKKLSRLAVQQDRYDQAKNAHEQQITLEKQQREMAAQQQMQQPVQQPVQQPKKPDPKAEEWAAKNEWFGQDETMTFATFGIHKKMVEQEGFDATTDDYYTELDNRIRNEFPHKFNGSSVAPKRQAVAGVSRSSATTSSGRNKKVRLTPSQVAIAKKLGVPLEEYAKYVK